MYKIKLPIRLIELFAGYGSQYMALKRLQDEGLCSVESWKVVEFDDIRHLSKWAARQIRKRKKLIASVIDVHKELEDVYINAVEIEFENGKRELVNPNILEYYGDTYLPEVTKEEVSDFLWD